MLLFGVDSQIKSAVEKKVKAGSVKKIWRDRLLIRKHHNKGVMLNAFEKYQKLTAAVSAGLTVLVILLGEETFAGKGRNTAGKLGFACLIGGALSNTFDRIRRGYVVDYMSFNVKRKKIKNLVFNISDFFIIAGVLITALSGEEKTREIKPV